MADPVVMKLPDGRVMVCAPSCPIHDVACNEFRFALNDHEAIYDFWWLHTINCKESVHISKSDIDNYVSKVSYRDIVIAPGPPDASPEWHMENMKRFPLKGGKLEGEK